MSSRVNINMLLISSKGLLDKERILKIFNEALVECNGSIKNNLLYINNLAIGKLFINERIVVETYTEHREKVLKSTETLREIFNRRVKIAVKNTQNDLINEKNRLMKSELELEELERKLKTIDDTILVQNNALIKQEMPVCEAMVAELKETATNQGYDIIEEETESGIQLQFIRRTY